MNLLAIEACTSVASTALFIDGVLAEERTLFDAPLTHSESLLPAAAELLTAHGLTPRDLGAVAVTRGPGSFTSVRICMATGWGLSAAAGVPLYAVDTLWTLAASLVSPGDASEDAAVAEGSRRHVLALLDARRGEVYGAWYEAASFPPRVLRAPQAGLLSTLRLHAVESSDPPIAIGSGALAYADELRAGGFLVEADPARHFPYAAALGRLVLSLSDEQRRATPATPLYLRSSEAERLRPTAGQDSGSTPPVR